MRGTSGLLHGLPEGGQPGAHQPHGAIDGLALCDDGLVPDRPRFLSLLLLDQGFTQPRIDGQFGQRSLCQAEEVLDLFPGPGDPPGPLLLFDGSLAARLLDPPPLGRIRDRRLLPSGRAGGLFSFEGRVLLLHFLPKGEQFVQRHLRRCDLFLHCLRFLRKFRTLFGTA